jgi:hypothetical protein
MLDDREPNDVGNAEAFRVGNLFHERPKPRISSQSPSVPDVIHADSPLVVFVEVSRQRASHFTARHSAFLARRTNHL